MNTERVNKRLSKLVTRPSHWARCYDEYGLEYKANPVNVVIIPIPYLINNQY